MFHGCSSLSSLNLSTFNTSKVIGMYDMFSGCKSLTSLDLSTFNTSNVKDMVSMFAGCSSLSSLDLSAFSTSSVGSDGRLNGCIDMFKECSNLNEVYVRDEKIKSELPSGVVAITM